MKVINVEPRPFLKERTIKFCIVTAFICIWLLVLVIYFARGQSTMSHLQSSLFQFMIATNLITLTLFLAAGISQIVSMKRKTSYKCTSIMAELVLLCFISCYQTVAAIALSAGSPSFPCTRSGTCRESVFFAIVAWIAPLLFSIHTIEFLVRARRAAVNDVAVWKAAAWTVDWEGTLSNSKDINSVEKGFGSIKVLVLPQSQAQKVNTTKNVKEKRNTLRKSLMPPPPPPPKTPSAFEQCVLILPLKKQYVVPRLGPPPKFFIRIPENIQYIVPRLGPPPCPSERRKERRKARRAHTFSRKLSRYLRLED